MKVTTIRIEDEIIENAKIKCIKKNISLSKYIQNLIKVDLQKEKKEEK